MKTKSPTKIIKQIVSEAFEAYLEAREKEEIPRIVDFKGSWVDPDEKHIEDQLKLASCLFDITYEDLLSKLKAAKAIKLTNELWAKLENTLSYHVKTVEEAQKIADEYGYHYNDAMFGYMNSREATLPVIVYKEGQNPYVVSGEPELLFASAFKIEPKVLIINL